MNSGVSSSGSVRQFVNDDEAYMDWLRENTSGYVVNSYRVPAPSYLILHRATCAAINSPARSNWTTTGYIKTCSLDPVDLADWAMQASGGTLKPCGMCKPLMCNPQASLANAPTHRAIGFRVSQKSNHTSRLPGTATAIWRAVPATIETGCEALDHVWACYAQQVVNGPQVAIRDTDDDLNWHAFLGHSLDMQGFRAAEFIGVDRLSRQAPDFIPLRNRGVGVPELAGLWQIRRIQDHLLRECRGTPFSTSLDVLRQFGGPVGQSLADALGAFPFRKGHWTVRAYLENAVKLSNDGFSFRQWLQREADSLGVHKFPPSDFREVVFFDGRSVSLEAALRARLKRTFYFVGPAIAAYMLCDWQLGLWREDKTAVFATFKLDAFHDNFVRRHGRGSIPASEDEFVSWWWHKYPEIPPRVANECIWLGMENGVP